VFGAQVRSVIAASLCWFGCHASVAPTRGEDCLGVPSSHLPGATAKTPELNQISAHLRELDEPVLQSGSERAVRLTIAPHDHPPIAIRFTWDDEGVIAHTARYDGAGGWCPADFPERERRFPLEKQAHLLSLGERHSFEVALAEFAPKGRPTAEADRSVAHPHVTEYLLELSGGGVYEYLVREAGSQTVREPSFERLCNTLVTISRVDADPYEAYCP
jgi:hypothetical protein